MHEAAHLQHAPSANPSVNPSAHPPARVQARVLPWMICMGRARAGLTVAAKAGADAPGGGISLCFCRRGYAAPAHQAFTLIHSAVFHLIAVGVVLIAFPYRRLRKRYPYDSSPVNAS